MPRVLLGLLLLATPLRGEDWPHWRGPARNGITPEASGWMDGRWLPDKPAWEARAGVGSSSPLVVGNRVFTLGRSEGHEWLRCWQLADGKELWKTGDRAPEYGRFRNGDEGFYAGPCSTPEYDAETKFVYTLGIDGNLACWDSAGQGKRIWNLNLYDAYKVKQRPKLTRAPMRDYGYTSTPLVHGNWLLVEVGSPEQGTLIAFDKKTGKQVWASDLRDEAGHNAGPAPMTVEGIPCVALLTQRGLGVIRLDPGNEGKTLATYPWITDFANNIAAVAVDGNHVLITSAYNQNAICKLRITRKGAEKVWQKPYPSKVCTPVIHGGHVYVAWQKVRCLDWETGELRWEGGTIGDPGSCLITADDRLIVYGHNGKLMLVETARRSPNAYRELAVRDGIFRTFAWPHVAVADGRLLVKDRDGHLACFVLGR